MGRWGEGKAQTGTNPPLPPQHPQREHGRGREGRRGPVGEGKGEPGEEQKIQARVGGNPVQSKANQNFKPYLRCLTSGEPDLGKGKERKKERGKKRRKRKKRGKKQRKHESSKSAGERGEKSFCCHNLKTLFNL